MVYLIVPLDIAEATQDIYTLFNQIANDKGVALTMDITENTKIFSDPNAFTTIVRNLVDNAIRLVTL